MQSGPEKHDRVAGLGCRDDRRFLRLLDESFDPVAMRPDQRCAIRLGKGREGPHHVDEIFDLAERALPHILIPVGELRERAGVQLDCLGEIELNPLAPIAKCQFGKVENRAVHDEIGHVRRPDKQPPETLRPLAVEAPFAKGGRGIARRKILGDTRDE